MFVVVDFAIFILIASKSLAEFTVFIFYTLQISVPHLDSK